MSQKNKTTVDKHLKLQQWLNRNKRKESGHKGIDRIPEGTPAPLSYGQKRLWVLQQLYPDNPFYHYPEAYWFSGLLDLELLMESFKQVAQRHRILDLTFEIQEGQPMQKNGLDTSLDTAKFDLSNLSGRARDEELRSIAIGEARRPFDLEKGPLVRVSILKLSTDSHLVIVTMHHIITDEWSMTVLREEWAASYQGRAIHSPVEISYVDYAHWQQNQKVDSSHLAYWKNKLGGELPQLSLPLDHLRPAKPSFRGALSKQTFSPDLFNKLRVLSKEADTTMFVLLLSVYKVLLYRYSNQTDLLIGTPISNRDQTSLENLIGFFNETIVLRSNLVGDQTFLDLVGQVRRTVLEAFTNKNVPFESLVQTLKPDRHLGTNPLFQVMFLYNNLPPTTSFGPKLKMEHKFFDFGVSKFDLTLHLAEEDDTLTATIEYALDLFDAGTIERMQGHFHKLLEEVTREPRQQIGGMQMLPEEEKQQLLGHYADTDPPAPNEKNIVRLIEAQAEANPDHPAVIFQEKSITYRSLNQQAADVAGYLLTKNIVPGSAVGLCCDRSHEMIIGILGILKAGAHYLPLDPTYPAERIQYMVDDAAISLILTQIHLVEQFINSNAGIVTFDEVKKASQKKPSSLTFPEPSGADIAYIIYTSGSTGRPKGVVISHQNLLHSTKARFSYYKIQPGVFLLLSSFGFDSSVAGIFWPLSVGGTLVISEHRIEQDLDNLAGLIDEYNVTHTLMLPSIYDLLLQHVALDSLNSLNTVIVAGEACYSAVCRRHFEKLPDVGLYNEYGPTEATVWSIAHQIRPENSSGLVPIGKPIENTHIYILDNYLQPMPIGIPGELYIGGPGVSKGYLNLPELTEARFVANPFRKDTTGRLYKSGDLVRYLPGGVIEFLGRVDSQVKIRGYRIEPEEIQEVLLSYKDVLEAVVAVKAKGDDTMPITQSTKQILGYVVGKPNLNLDDLRRYLKAKLPSYMVPAVVIRLETLPLLPNGKLDTKSLPEPKESTVRDEDDFVAPKSEREQQLVRIWEEVLNVSPVGIHDNFFEIGGDSILSIQVITRVRKAGLKLSATQLFEHQTIAELALFVKLANEVKDHEVVVTGPAILTPIQQWFFEVHQASPHHWNHIISFELPTDINTDVISRGIRHLIERHDALRLVFLKNNGNWIGEVNAPKDIAGFQLIDLSDLSPEIQSKAVSERIAEIQAKTKLAEGGLFQGIYFDCGTDQKHRLILLAHHLIIDTVSWSILIEELSSVVQSLKLGQTISLPPTTTAFAKWGAQLDQYAKSESLNSQIGFWEAQTQVPEILPSDFEVSFPIAESSITIFPHEMSEEQTELMLTEALKAYSTRPDEMLITALMLALADWKGISELCLGLERHGREVIDESLDLSNSVGWFTAFFPIKLNIERSADIGTILKTVKEQLRQPLQGGIGYGVLRYLSGNKKLDQQPRVLFNYLGNQHGFDSPIFGRGEFIGQDSRDPQNERYYQLEVNAYVTDGKLQTRWSYCRDQFKVDNIKHLVTCFNSALQSLNRHCTEIESGGYTPSDFPEADLSQSDLDNLFDQL